METVLIKTVAAELGIVKEYALRLAKKHGFQIHYGRRNVASLLKADAVRLIQEYEPRRTTNGNALESTENNASGPYSVRDLAWVELDPGRAGPELMVALLSAAGVSASVVRRWVRVQAPDTEPDAAAGST